jgi:hypothetical protein
VGELCHPVDGQEHEELSFGQAQLAAVDVDVADRGLGETLALGRFLLVPRRAGEAVPFEAAVESAGIASRRQPRTSWSGSKVRRRNSTMMASSAPVRTVLRGWRGPWAYRRWSAGRAI